MYVTHSPLQFQDLGEPRCRLKDSVTLSNRFLPLLHPKVGRKAPKFSLAQRSLTVYVCCHFFLGVSSPGGNAIPTAVPLVAFVAISSFLRHHTLYWCWRHAPFHVDYIS